MHCLLGQNKYWQILTFPFSTESMLSRHSRHDTPFTDIALNPSRQSRLLLAPCGCHHSVRLFSCLSWHSAVMFCAIRAIFLIFFCLFFCRKWERTDSLSAKPFSSWTMLTPDQVLQKADLWTVLLCSFFSFLFFFLRRGVCGGVSALCAFLSFLSWCTYDGIWEASVILRWCVPPSYAWLNLYLFFLLSDSSRYLSLSLTRSDTRA